MTDQGVHLVFTTASAADAERIASHLVDERLAACVNVVGGVVSHYLWEGKRERSEEVLLVIKTRADLRERLRAAIVAIHPYDLPEVVELEVAGGHPPYLNWVRESCGPRERP